MTDHKGIYWDKGYKKYHVRVYIDGKYQHVGRFDTLEQAIAAKEVYVPLEKDNLVSFEDDLPDNYFPKPKKQPRRTKAWFEQQSKLQLKNLPRMYA